MTSLVRTVGVGGPNAPPLDLASLLNATRVGQNALLAGQRATQLLANANAILLNNNKAGGAAPPPLPGAKAGAPQPLPISAVAGREGLQLLYSLYYVRTLANLPS